MKQMDKKGAELTLNIIVVAVILLMVLVIVIFFFTNQLGNQGEIIGQGNQQTANCIENPNHPDCTLLDGLRGNGNDNILIPLFPAIPLLKRRRV